MCTRIAMPNRRPSGNDQVNGSRIAEAHRPVSVARPTRQFYHCPQEQAIIPAGTLDAGEPPERAAVRELEEETGYRAGRWRKLAEFFPSPGVLNERTHVFVAEELTPGPMRPEPGEDLQPHLVAWSDAVRWAMDGTIRDAKTLIALLLWDRLSRDKT